MGFIEDERRRKAKLDVQRERRSLIEQQKRKQREREASAEAARKVLEETSEIKMEKSKQHFEQSGLGGMITELGELGSHKEAAINSRWGDHHQVSISLSISGLEGIVSHSHVEVDTTADGTITIRGNDSHSTTLSKDKWQGKKGREVLERALERAYKHPKYSFRGFIPPNMPDH
jgi:hypothetical protein